MHPTICNCNILSETPEIVLNINKRNTPSGDFHSDSTENDTSSDEFDNEDGDGRDAELKNIIQRLVWYQVFIGFLLIVSYLTCIMYWLKKKLFEMKI